MIEEMALKAKLELISREEDRWKVRWIETRRSGKIMSRSKTVNGRADAETMVRVIEATPKGQPVTNWSLHEAGVGHLGDTLLPVALFTIDQIIGLPDLTDAEKLKMIRDRIRQC